MAIDRKTKGKIINTLRRLSFSHSGRSSALARQKRAPATFECEQCSTLVYTGTKALNKCDFIEGLRIANPNSKIIKGKVTADHIVPVVPVEGFKGTDWDWNVFIDNLFVEEGGWQILCDECNIWKTAEENRMCQEVKRKNKQKKK